MAIWDERRMLEEMTYRTEKIMSRYMDRMQYAVKPMMQVSANDLQKMYVGDWDYGATTNVAPPKPTEPRKDIKKLIAYYLLRK